MLNEIKFFNQYPFVDLRGEFSRTYSESWGFPTPAQTNVSITTAQGTLRGFHYEKSLSSEWKLMRVIRGEIFFVCIDISALKDGRKRILWNICSQKVNNGIFIPPTFANCFLTLKDDVIITYSMGSVYENGEYETIWWNDPVFKDVPWPITPRVISNKDSSPTDFMNENIVER